MGGFSNKQQPQNQGGWGGQQQGGFSGQQQGGWNSQPVNNQPPNWNQPNYGNQGNWGGQQGGFGNQGSGSGFGYWKILSDYIRLWTLDFIFSWFLDLFRDMMIE